MNKMLLFFNIFLCLSSNLDIKICNKSVLNIEKYKDVDRSVKDIYEEACKILDEYLINNKIKKSDLLEEYKRRIKIFKDSCLSLIKSDNLIKLKSNDKSINFIMKKYPNLKVYVYNDSSYNLLNNGHSGCFCFSNFIFIHESCKDNIGVIMHEISHAINKDCEKHTYLKFLLSFIYDKIYSEPLFSDSYWKNFSLWLKINELRKQFNIKFEERADKFAACFGKKYANDLSNCLKQYIGIDSQISSEFQTHPKTEERIEYLNNFHN